MNIDSNSTVRFGWHYPMHAKILQTSVKDTKINSDIFQMLLKSVQQPDLDEFFLYGQSHFYYPDDIIKSYFDITCTHNAKYAFKKHVMNMLKAVHNNDKIKGADEAGRALHYLQDMTQPNHIESGSIVKKAFDKNMHADFESQAFQHQNTLCENYSVIDINETNFNDLFSRTVEMSKKNHKPNENNKAQWLGIAQNGINTAIASTKNFIDMYLKII